MQQAAEWYATLRDGNANEQLKAEWQQWLDADVLHLTAWQDVETISHQFEPLKTIPEPKQVVDKFQTANHRLIKRRRVLNSIILLGGTGLLSYLGWRHTSLPTAVITLQADYKTGVGELQEILLADGSKLWLNTSSAIDTHFNEKLRLTTLLSGELFIDTAADRARPFIVDTRHGRLRALGTRFNIFQTESKTMLGVYEGAVEINTNGQNHIIKAGQQVSFTSTNIGMTEKADMAREAWKRGILIAEDITLRKLVDELGRYHQGHLSLDEKIEDLKVYGNFPANDTVRVLDMLTAVLPIQIKQPLPWWTSIQPK
ncbi:MAG: FecR domain-containing protein [Pseudomonadota bacterium]